MMRLIALAAITLALLVLATGCATEQRHIVRTERVDVPVPVPCRVAEVPRPSWPLDNLPPDAGLYEIVRAALVEIEQRAAYEAMLRAALAACRAPLT